VRKWRSRFTVSGTAGLGDAPRPGRRKADLVLTDAERELTRWARRTKTSQVLALRAKIVLACADGRENKAVAALLRTSEHNVARWRGGSSRAGWTGWATRSAPGRPRVSHGLCTKHRFAMPHRIAFGFHERRRREEYLCGQRTYDRKNGRTSMRE
jgi:hypothetical protein